MTGIVRCTIILVLLAPALFAAPSSADAEKVWSLEKTYWEYVQADDLGRYRTLWDSDFLGWQSVSPEPLRKGHITDWITAHTSKGETLKSYDLERLTMQATDKFATVTYRVRLTWVGQEWSWPALNDPRHPYVAAQRCWHLANHFGYVGTDQR